MYRTYSYTGNRKNIYYCLKLLLFLPFSSVCRLCFRATITFWLQQQKTRFLLFSKCKRQVKEMFYSKPRNVWKLFVISVVFWLLLSCGTSRTASVKPITATDDVWSENNIAAFEKKLEALRNHYHIPSLSVGIINEKKLTWKKGFGYSDIENQKKPDENTVYQLESITKTFGSLVL